MARQQVRKNSDYGWWVQTPDNPDNWLWKDLDFGGKDGVRRWFSKEVTHPTQDTEYWAECTNEEKEEWVAANPWWGYPDSDMEEPEDENVPPIPPIPDDEDEEFEPQNN